VPVAVPTVVAPNPPPNDPPVALPNPPPSAPPVANPPPNAPPVTLPKLAAGFTAAPKGEAAAAPKGEAAAGLPPKLPDDATVENENILLLLGGVTNASGAGEAAAAAGAAGAADMECAAGFAPAAAILRAKSPSVGLIPCVSHGRAEAAAGFVVDEGAADMEFAAGFAPAAAILRAKSPSVGLMPCVSHGRADDEACFAGCVREVADAVSDTAVLVATENGDAVVPGVELQGGTQQARCVSICAFVPVKQVK
jgi:uncharacterized protein YbbK (DUF523 family)